MLAGLQCWGKTPGKRLPPPPSEVGFVLGQRCEEPPGGFLSGVTVLPVFEDLTGKM